MNILFVTPIFPPEIGGPAQYAQKLQEVLQELSDRVEIIFGKRAFSFGKIWTASAKSDIVYVFSSSPRILIPAFFAAKLRRKKVVLRLGGDYLWERAAEQRGVTLSLRLYYEERRKSRKEKLISAFLKWIFKRLDVMIFTTEFQKKLYQRQYGLQSANVAVIENAYPFFGEREERLFPDFPLTILFAGRLLKLKNIETLIRGFSRLVQESPGKEVRLKIVGDGPEEKKLRKLARSLGLEKKVIFEKALPQEGLWRELQSAWLLVVPSFFEISPNIVLEACAAGSPILVTREVGLPSSITKNLIMFNPLDEAMLVESMRSFLDEERWKAYQKQILAIDVTRTMSIVAREHQTLFHGLLSG
ncbi:MAG: glycosyltransferase family 4 protein [Candidatus Spechtbacteria bacterium]|nr:glycosyltransferase family 4 protein [Candidatus Spechtbacteria bacterium]